jgi:hypothetical protein
MRKTKNLAFRTRLIHRSGQCPCHFPIQTFSPMPLRPVAHLDFQGQSHAAAIAAKALGVVATR